MPDVRGRGREGVSLVVTLVVIGIIAIGLGYLMGSYTIRLLARPPQEAIEPSGRSADRATSPSGTSSEVSRGGGSPNSVGSSAGRVAPGIPSETGTTSHSAETVGEPGIQARIYRVQVGVFENRENAERLAEKLTSDGYQVYVNSTPPFKVQVGAFENEENAKRLAKELESKGYQVYITK